jgi:hypothetical protein
MPSKLWTHQVFYAQKRKKIVLNNHSRETLFLDLNKKRNKRYLNEFCAVGPFCFHGSCRGNKSLARRRVSRQETQNGLKKHVQRLQPGTKQVSLPKFVCFFNRLDIMKGDSKRWIIRLDQFC